MAKKVSLPCLSFQMGWSKQNGNLNWGKNDLFWVNEIRKGHIISVVDTELFTKMARLQFVTNTHKNICFLIINCGGCKIRISDLLQLLWMNKTNVVIKNNLKWKIILLFIFFKIFFISFFWKKWKIILFFIFHQKLHTWQKFWFASYGPKCFQPIRLQDSSKYMYIISQ